MNLILFETAELALPLPPDDTRALHLRNVVRRSIGETFDLGVINGQRGKGRIEKITADGAIFFSYTLGAMPNELPPIRLIVGLTRPQTARKILREATALGVRSIDFVTTEKSEPSYAESQLWHSGEVRALLIEAAQQAFCTRLPVVSSNQKLFPALGRFESVPARLALDNYEATETLSRAPLPSSDKSLRQELLLAIGPERGWGQQDRAVLRSAGFSLVSIGERVLRTETAVIAALTLSLARLNKM